MRQRETRLGPVEQLAVAKGSARNKEKVSERIRNPPGARRLTAALPAAQRLIQLEQLCVRSLRVLEGKRRIKMSAACTASTSHLPTLHCVCIQGSIATITSALVLLVCVTVSRGTKVCVCVLFLANRSVQHDVRWRVLADELRFTQLRCS